MVSAVVYYWGRTAKGHHDETHCVGESTRILRRRGPRHQTVDTILRTAGDRADGLPPVYVRRQIVHNKHVVEQLAGRGAVFVEELNEIPDAAAEAGIPVVFSAHGVSPRCSVRPTREA